MTKTETLNLRVSSEFKRRLAEEAAKEKRSVTNYVETTLTAIWDRAGAGRVSIEKAKGSPLEKTTDQMGKLLRGSVTRWTSF